MFISPTMSNNPTAVNKPISGTADLVAIGRRIAALRHEVKITQDQLAAGVGVGRSTIASVERGIDRAGLLSTVAIADYFKVPMDWLLGRCVPVGGPFTDQITQNPDELHLMTIWRRLPVEDRRVMLKMIQAAADQERRAA
jgi:transcriptional regulator with XRE-family HTH domain